MVKSLFSMIIVALLLVGGAIYENKFVTEQFSEFSQVLSALYEKVDERSATIDDVYAVQENWLEKKKSLHTFIPHNEIKEIDLWLSESTTLVRDEQWEDAISKIEVLKELAEQIPKTFQLTLGNIF